MTTRTTRLVLGWSAARGRVAVASVRSRNLGRALPATAILDYWQTRLTSIACVLLMALVIQDIPTARVQTPRCLHFLPLRAVLQQQPPTSPAPELISPGLTTRAMRLASRSSAVQVPVALSLVRLARWERE